MKTPTLLSLSALALSLPVFAASFADYDGFGVTSGQLYGFYDDGSTLDITLLANQGGNHLATDVTRGRLLYTSSTSSGQNLWAYEVDTDTLSNLGTITIGDGSSSGGASFYNDAYYFYKDEGTNRGIYKVTFKVDGTVDSITNPFGTGNSSNPVNSIGLGDVAITPSGLMYIFTTNQGLWSLDLTNETTTPSFTQYNYVAGSHTFPMNGGNPYGTAGQLFLDRDADLVTWHGDHFDKIVFDGVNYHFEEKSSKTGLSTNPEFIDFSSSPVPEPSSLLLVGLAGLFGFRRRR